MRAKSRIRQPEGGFSRIRQSRKTNKHNVFDVFDNSLNVEPVKCVFDDLPILIGNQVRTYGAHEGDLIDEIQKLTSELNRHLHAVQETRIRLRAAIEQVGGQS